MVSREEQMSNRPSEKLKRIIEREHPGARIPERSQYDSIPGLDSPLDAPDFASADMDVLRRRYIGEETDGRDSQETASMDLDDLDEPEQELVDVEIEVAAGQIQRKTVVVSAKEDEIIGEQG